MNVGPAYSYVYSRNTNQSTAKLAIDGGKLDKKIQKARVQLLTNALQAKKGGGEKKLLEFAFIKFCSEIKTLVSWHKEAARVWPKLSIHHWNKQLLCRKISFTLPLTKAHRGVCELDNEISINFVSRLKSSEWNASITHEMAVSVPTALILLISTEEEPSELKTTQY